MQSIVVIVVIVVVVVVVESDVVVLLPAHCGQGGAGRPAGRPQGGGPAHRHRQSSVSFLHIGKLKTLSSSLL